MSADLSNTNGNDFGGQTERQVCYESILTCSAEKAEDAYDQLCNYWQACCGASMVSLWLYNGFSGTFELNGLATHMSGNPFRNAPQLTEESVFYFVRERKSPQAVTSVVDWARTQSSKTFRVVTREWLREQGLLSALYVPVLNNIPSASIGQGHQLGDCSEQAVEGIMSLHFPPFNDSVWCRPINKDDELSDKVARSLLLLGRMSSLLIAKLRLKQQAKVGDALARLAGRHLTRVREEPHIVRREYLEGVLKLIKDELGICAASVWSRVPFNDSLRCLFSMGGLQRTSDGKILFRKSEFADAEYNPEEWRSTSLDKEPWTYQAFRTGEYRLWKPDTGEPHQPKYRDLMNAKPQGSSPIVIMPIPEGSEMSREGSACQPLGVLRCAHKPGERFGPDASRTFDVVEVRLLEFICRQLSPVLHSLETRILREDAISIIKHDTGTSLGSLRDMIDEIETKFPDRDGDVAYALQNLRESAMSAASLTDRLTRDVELSLKMDPAKTDLGREIMPRVKRLLTPYAREKGMRIAFDGFESLPALNVDPKLVERALYNLIVNAVKYGTPNTDIKIQAHAEGDGYAVDVSNEGDGVREEDIPHLFRMYFRSRHARGEGSGLGLSIVRQIMRSHKGDVTLLSPRHPTIFRCFIPRNLRD